MVIREVGDLDHNNAIVFMKKPFAKRKLTQLGRRLGYELLDSKEPAELFPWLLGFIRSPRTHTTLEDLFLREVLSGISSSKAQLCQDLMVLMLTGYKRGGFFVEFGATDGISLSNTYLLEAAYGWKGILAEPASVWHESLNRNRACIIDHRCVWCNTGEQLRFTEARDAELSTVTDLSEGDGHRDSRKNGAQYIVESISLADLLDSHKAPSRIDYLSIDTEGSEFLILDAFDFSKYHFEIITVEHNYTKERHEVRKLLKKNGYRQVLAGFSQWDDWYVKESSGLRDHLVGSYR